MAIEMLKLVKKIKPDIFIHAGPPCLNSKCPRVNFTAAKLISYVNSFTALRQTTLKSIPNSSRNH